jgi:outer membrane beta-barrel protein
MTARALSRALALAAALVCIAVARPALAQSKSDAFAGKIPPVSGQLYQKAGRWEVTPSANLSLNDAFFNKYFFGLKVGYHFTEAWSLSVQGAAGATSKAGASQVCAASAGCTQAADWMLYQVPGKITGLAGLEVGWSPIYGKLNVLAERVAHFDLSILGGADAIRHAEVVDAARARDLAAAGQAPASVLSFGGHVGLGARLFLAEWVALRLEVKDYIYSVTVPSNVGGGDIQNQIFTELGVSFFFPFNNRPLP